MLRLFFRAAALPRAFFPSFVSLPLGALALALMAWTPVTLAQSSLAQSTPVVSFPALSSPGQASASPPRQPVVQVTATRTPVLAEDALSHVSVITREDIDASGTLDVVALLRREAGVDIVRGGGFGQQASVFLRGTNSSHVLVLVDGVRVSSVNTGGYAWEHLPLEQVQRIEIVRGPRAALYGSDAIGGVVQIFTRRARGPEGSVAVGNHDTAAVAAGFGQESANGRWGVRAGRTYSGGINVQRPGGFSFDPDDDGFDTRNLSLDGALQLGRQTLQASGLATRSDVEFDQGESALANHSLAATLHGPLSERWSHRLLLSGNRETLQTEAFSERLDSRRRQLDWQHDVQAGDSGTLLFGASHLRERGVSTALFDGSRNFDQSRRNTAAFVFWRDVLAMGGSGSSDYELALRHDRSSQFGDHTTGQAAVGWHPAADTRVFASHGQGFRAPTFNELFSPGFGGQFAGNPALQPERSRSSELGLRQHWGALHASLHAFRTDIDELVDFSGADFQAINVRRARIEGVELGLGTSMGAWTLHADATWQDPRDRDTGAQLLRRPARKANLRLERQFQGGLRLALDGHASGARAEFGGGRLPGYAVLGLSASLPLGPATTLDLGVENLFDREYTLVDGFNTPGQTVLLRLRWDG